MSIIVQTLSEQIYALMRDRIISGVMPVDTAIRQDALAAELGVSKIPLREAFARLEQDGLLLYVTNRGFFIRPLSVDEVEEVYALRLKIEPDAVAEAATVATDKDKQVALDCLKALDEAVVSDKKKVGKLNRAYHMALVKPIQRPITTQIVERLNIISERYVGKHLEPAGRDSRAHDEHAAMYELWASGKSKEVAAIMAHHISSTLEDLRKQFELEKAG
ncbi:bacterial regulatory protein, gntR family protein [Asticcacaulis biprosthecium C19]|uniref:Bacterial regulatory protein, gntR family protein n=1 Tax=Asticcacaulis biprosthecium C19 TaxID=715226 RepID=F4QI75_9CAUL|nr:GntR family transcriptional regulator [Asticcacaulis biprosthecium]EGF91713.1 bacterial regulatory protein, gntR family protein [Asticcacaulis biprosthecium C19]